MSGDLPQVYLSAIDEDRFGIRTARVSNVTADKLLSVIDFCETNNVVFLIARCQSSEIKATQAMENHGFILMDTLVYYEQKLFKTKIPSDTGSALVRPIKSGEEDEVKTIATKSFKGYFGHYHADSRLDREKCDEVYSSWALRSCISKEVANEVLVAEIEDTIVGFATLRLNSSDEGEGVLFGVAPDAQNLGIYRSFMINGMNWCRSKGAMRMVVSTQINNIAVQKVWSRLGFEFSYAYYTFHKWFDK